MRISEIKDKYQKHDGTMYGEKNIENSLAMLYHENSKFTSYSFREEGMKIRGFNNPYVNKRAYQSYKCYPNHSIVDLEPYKENNPKVDFFDLLKQRTSLRDYEGKYKVSLNELSTILYNSYGVNRKVEISGINQKGHMGLRNVPSGGGLFPLELYIVVLNAHISSGLYHYRPDVNCLEFLKEGEFLEELSTFIHAEPYVNMKESSFIVISTGIIERVLIKYGDRGYRFLMQEVGLVAQNISLTSESIGLGSCIIGGYNDDMANHFLGIDGVFETINNVIIIGKRRENECSD